MYILIEHSSKFIHNIIPKIEFKNVSFSYEASEKYSLSREPKSMILSESLAQQAHVSRVSLENISFKIYPKETIGIIGGTGSGKSTLINLISRFYDASRWKNIYRWT